MRRRWPAWIYGKGDEPDYRFSLANERTFLAWIRTSLALLAAGVAVDVVELSLPETTQLALAVLLIALGMAAAVLAWLRWALAERAIRRSRPLPAFGVGVALAAAIVVVAIVLLAQRS